MASALEAYVGRTRPVSAGRLLRPGVAALATGLNEPAASTVRIDVAIPVPVSVGASAVGEVTADGPVSSVGDVAVEASGLVLGPTKAVAAKFV